MCRSRSISLLSVPWTLACEDGNSKLFGVVTVADLLNQLEVRNRKGAESGLVADVDFVQTLSPRFGQDFKFNFS